MRTIDQTMPEGLIEYTWLCEALAHPVVCWIEVDPGEPASWDCPGSQTTAIVVDAFCCGTSIRGILAPWILNEIEDDFLYEASVREPDSPRLAHYDDNIEF